MDNTENNVSLFDHPCAKCFKAAIDKVITNISGDCDSMFSLNRKPTFREIFCNFFNHAQCQITKCTKIKSYYLNWQPSIYTLLHSTTERDIKNLTNIATCFGLRNNARRYLIGFYTNILQEEYRAHDIQLSQDMRSVILFLTKGKELYPKSPAREKCAYVIMLLLIFTPYKCPVCNSNFIPFTYNSAMKSIKCNFCNGEINMKDAYRYKNWDYFNKNDDFISKEIL